MSRIIEHQGKVIRVLKDKVDVLIIQNSACSGCHAKSACTASDSAEKVIEIPVFNNKYQIGDIVTIQGTTTMGWKAVFYAFMLPFFILMAILITVQQVWGNELYAGILSLAILIPYYFILYLLREKMKNKFHFTLKQ